MTAPVKPRHRDQRDHHYEDGAGERVHVFGAGGVVSACERYCAGCDVWLDPYHLLTDMDP